MRIICLAAIFTLSLFCNISVAQEKKGDKKNENWEPYLNTIDIYANQKAKLPTEHKLEKHSSTKAIIPSNDNERNVEKMALDASLQQKREAASQRRKVNNLFNEVPKLHNTETLQNNVDESYLIPHTIEPAFTSKRVHYNWGGKQDGFKYVDYEFRFDATDTNTATELSHHLKKMADAGWLVDLNRSMQTVSGSGNNLRAFTVMEMRFRKPD